MYSTVAISALIDRIGWSEVQSSDYPLVLTADNKKADSGRTFDNFHGLVTIDNIYSALPKIGMAINDFNAYLLDLKGQHSRRVLTDIMNRSGEYVDSFDYDDTILAKVHLFDDPLGYSLAASMIELFIGTSRSNFRERNSKLAYDKLKIELEGARNDRGIKVAAGIKDKYEVAVKEARRIIFPFSIPVTSKPIW
jgi:hypothetical protein